MFLYQLHPTVITTVLIFENKLIKAEQTENEKWLNKTNKHKRKLKIVHVKVHTF